MRNSRPATAAEDGRCDSVAGRGVARILGILLVAALCGCAGAPPATRVIYSGPGLFGGILVTEDAHGIRRLTFGSQVVTYQTVAKPDDPGYLEFEYARIMAMAPAVLGRAPARVLVLGLGGGTLPRFIRAAWPAARIDVAEIDPAVVTVAERYFGLVQDEGLKVHVGDARSFIEAAAPGAYDLVLLDAFSDREAPRHLTTVEFLRSVRAALRVDGLAASNLWGPNANPRYFDMVATMSAAFGELRAVYAPHNVNVVVFAGPVVYGLTREELLARLRSPGDQLLHRYDLGTLVEAGWLDIEPAIRRGTLLRDNPSP